MSRITAVLSFTLFVSLTFLARPTLSQNIPGPAKTLDQIVAVVNDHTILKSEVDQQVVDYMVQLQSESGQSVEFTPELWYTVLQNITERYVLLDMALADSVTIPDETVDQQINNRIQQVVEQVGSEAAVERQMGRSIVQIRSDLRQSFREEMIVQQYRQQKLSEVTITRPEVIDYFNRIPADSLPTIPERVSLSQIVRIPSPMENARAEARALAEQLRDSILNHGIGIEELARRHSDGPSASGGGYLSLIPLDDLVPEYSAAAAALAPGEISEVVETSFGFHVIRLNRRQGDQIDTNHILIEIDDDSYDEQAAIDFLNSIRDSVLSNPDISFAEMARRHSDDPQSAPRGGRLLDPQTGDRLIRLADLDPALYRIVLLLDEVGEISQPRPFNTGSGNNSQRAYRIVRLDNRVEEHIANLEQDFDLVRQVALQEKQYNVISEWIEGLKEEVYIEYKIPLPGQFAETN